MWYKLVGDQVEVRIFAKPNAKKSAVTGVTENGLCVALHARAQEGEANAELIAYLAGYFGVPKSKVLLRRGVSGRRKVVVLPVTETVRELLGSLSKS